MNLKIEIGKKTQVILALLLLAGVVGAVSEYGDNVIISGYFSGNGGNITGINPVNVNPAVDSYSNHLGVVDNFTQVVVSDGVLTPDGTNHEIDIDSGNGEASYAIFQTKKTWTPSSKPIIANFLVTNLVNGTGSGKQTRIGLETDFTDSSIFAAPLDTALFIQLTDNSWNAFTQNGGNARLNAISAINNGDLLTITLTTSKVQYMVNGVVVATHTDRIPDDALYAGAVVLSTVADGTSRTASIDLMDIQAYK